MSKEAPHDIDAERALLGAVLLDDATLEIAVEHLGPHGDDVFYSKTHATIYDAMLRANLDGQRIDSITLVNALRKNNALDGVGGASYIAELSSAVPTSANIERYASIVREKADLRALGQTCVMIYRQIENGDDAREVMDSADAKLNAILQRKSAGKVVSLDSIVPAVVKQLHEQAEGGTWPGFPCGIPDLDKILGGFKPSDLVIVAARPSVGKTAFALNTAHFLAKNRIAEVLVFSLEMAAEQFALRMLAIDQGVDVQQLREGFNARMELRKADAAVESLRGMPFMVDDTPGATLWEIRSRSRAFASKNDNPVIIVDYLQLVRALTQKQNRYLEIGDITRGLKSLAREINAPVVVLCQLSREAEMQPDGFRMLSTLRESGDIEQDADVVVILHRPTESVVKTYEEKHGVGSADNIVQATVAKHRNGPTGKVSLVFDKKQQRFHMLARPGSHDPMETSQNKAYSHKTKPKGTENNTGLFFSRPKPEEDSNHQHDLTPVINGEELDLPF